MTRKVICILLCAAMAFALSACGILDKSDDVAALQARISELECQLEAVTPDSGGPENTASASVQYVLAANALVYHEGNDPASAVSVLELMEPASVVITPLLSEGTVVDYWDINGQEVEPVENQALALTLESTTFIKAVLRDELKVTSVNAYMQFLDENGDPAGDPFYEYVFEYDDENVSGKVITVYVRAEVPSGYTVDYWKINNVPYYYNKAVTAFTVENLDETTVYEVFFRKLSTSAATPSPTTTPAPTPEITPSPTETPGTTFVAPSFSFPVFTMPPISYIPIVTTHPPIG